MPVYCYQCNSCESKFEVKHSMTFDSQLCLICQSSNVFRLPSEISLTSVSVVPNTKQKPGKIVDEYIRETKKEIEKEKKNLKGESFGN